MWISKPRPVPLELRALVQEASRALARLDADRLEEMALSCQALMLPANAESKELLRRQTYEAARDMAIFARVLDATRANLEVMRRLRALRSARIEYGGCERAETRYGHD